MGLIKYRLEAPVGSSHTCEVSIGREAIAPREYFDLGKSRAVQKDMETIWRESPVISVRSWDFMDPYQERRVNNREASWTEHTQ
jgi:hypothetical protein